MELIGFGIGGGDSRRLCLPVLTCVCGYMLSGATCWSVSEWAKVVANFAPKLTSSVGLVV